MKPPIHPHHRMAKQNVWALIILGVVIIVSIAFLIYVTGKQPQIPPAIPLTIQRPAHPASTKSAGPFLPRPRFGVIVPAIVLGYAKITDASPAVFAYAHGTAVAGNDFVIGMANREGNQFMSNKLLLFTDPEYLNRFLTVLFPHSGDVETMVFDPASDQIYFLLTGSKNLELYGFDPHTLNLRTIASSTSIDPGAKPAIVTDGTYVYGITNTAPSTLFKVKIADGTITSSSQGHISYGHSAAIGIYGDSVELYFGGGMSDMFEKADGATLSVLSKVNLSPCSETDDMPYQEVDAQSGYVYVGCEIQPYGYRIHTSDLSAARFLLPGSSLGLYIFGGDLYNAAQDGNLDVFPHLDLGQLQRYHIASSSLVNAHNQALEPNELFFASSTRNLYFTAWYGTPGLYRVATSTE